MDEEEEFPSMSALLTKEMEQTLLQVLARHPDFVTPYDRRRFLLQALRSAPDGEEITYSIDVSGDSEQVGDRVLDKLEFAGMGPDRLYRLRYLIAYLVEKSRDDQIKSALSGMVTALDQQAAAVNTQQRGAGNARPPISTSQPLLADPQLGLDDNEWHGERDADLTLEKVVRVNTLRHLYVIERGMRAARGVFRIEGPKPGNPAKIIAATGFIVARKVETTVGRKRLALAMTNHHVIASIETLPAFEFWFNYRLNIEGEEQDAGSDGFLKAKGNALNEWFFTNKTLDVTVFALDDDALPEDAFALSVCEERSLPGARVPIIQHPNGEPMQISYQSNFIEYANDEILQYTTTTLPGSSGAPVFNERYDVIGIHCKGGDLIDPVRPERRVLRNQGTSMKAILPHLPATIRKQLRLIE
jgi:hypothetical protein